MDFAITTDGVTADMTADKAGDIFNNIVTTLAIKKGSWWNDPNFGVTDRPRLKITPANIRLIQQDIEQALQWIIDAGRATSIVVTTWRDEEQRHRVNCLISATQADGRIITYDTFREVV